MDSQLEQSSIEIQSMPLFIKQAIAEYTHHVEINKVLRANKQLSVDLENLLKSLDIAFALVTPLEHDIVVYRGVKPRDDKNTFYADDLGFSSTAMDPEVSKTFAGEKCCGMMIGLEKGTSVLRIPANVAVFGEESEVLLYRGGRFVESSTNYGPSPFDPEVETFHLTYVQRPLEKFDDTLMDEIRLYMKTNMLFFEFLRTSDIRGFERFLDSRNYSLMFRCMVGDIFMLNGMEPFFEVLLSQFPDVVNTIPGLSDYLNGYSIVSERVERIYDFEFNKRPKWEQDTSIEKKRYPHNFFTTLCAKDVVYRVRMALAKNRSQLHIYDDMAIRSASKHGNTEVIKFLIDEGATVTAVDNESLRLASANGHLEAVKLLLMNGADIHARRDQALRFASANGHLEVVKFLVANNANVSAVDNEALKLAAINGHLEVVKYLSSL
jgi:hypothetical protein